MLVGTTNVHDLHNPNMSFCATQFLHHTMNYCQEKQNTRVLVCPKVRVPSLVFLIPAPDPIFPWHEQPLTEDKTTHL